jgi:hypothetical protein
MIYLVHDKVQYTVESGDVNDFHRNLPEIKADIQAMRDCSDSPQKWGFKPNKWDIVEQHGITTVNIYGGREEEEEEERDIEEEEEAIIDKYCLLVEITTDAYADRYSPYAFAIFVPEGEGHIPETVGVANMTFKGVIKGKVENKIGVHDPPGLIDEEHATKRLWWCRSGVINSQSC